MPIEDYAIPEHDKDEKKSEQARYVYDQGSRISQETAGTKSEPATVSGFSSPESSSFSSTGNAGKIIALAAGVFLILWGSSLLIFLFYKSKKTRK
ncbi:MAG: hypothetical protein LBR51_01120 [Bacteroidales bacterium]|jgi:hypothetical protein|nr:hypothetical protein [Bacteroidales bacterium]